MLPDISKNHIIVNVLFTGQTMYDVIPMNNI